METKQDEEEHLGMDAYETVGDDESTLGKGSFGKVRKIRRKGTSKIYALKTIRKADVLEGNMVEQVEREIEVQKALKHPNVLRLYKHFEDDEQVYLLLEYCAQGELYQILRTRRGRRFPEPVARQYFLQVASGLQYLHSRQIVHRDIKPENLLVNHEDVIKIADFGWCAVSREPRHTFCGTLDYLAPEMIQGKGHDHTLDLWGLGVLLYEMVVGKPPFQSTDHATLISRILSLDYKIPPFVNPDAGNLISRLLKRDPSQRLPLENVFRHPWAVGQSRPVREVPKVGRSLLPRSAQVRPARTTSLSPEATRRGRRATPVSQTPPVPRRDPWDMWGSPMLHSQTRSRMQSAASTEWTDDEIRINHAAWKPATRTVFNPPTRQEPVTSIETTPGPGFRDSQVPPPMLQPSPGPYTQSPARVPRQVAEISTAGAIKAALENAAVFSSPRPVPLNRTDSSVGKDQNAGSSSMGSRSGAGPSTAIQAPVRRVVFSNMSPPPPSSRRCRMGAHPPRNMSPTSTFRQTSTGAMGSDTPQAPRPLQPAMRSAPPMQQQGPASPSHLSMQGPLVGSGARPGMHHSSYQPPPPSGYAYVPQRPGRAAGPTAYRR
mmetsp:Transcript_67139/g.153753  ORF Transcript_67139/g.153753 Transcript_67139/m.153753 type:complete len:603 (+) Transcript_67139:70-1878(+)